MTAGAITLSESDFRKGLVAKRLAYGDAVREPLGLARIPTIVATCYKRAAIAVSEFKYEKPLADRTKALPAEDAFYPSIHLRGVSHRQIWLGDRAVETSPAAPASFAVHDLRQEPSFRSTTPAHAIGFYFSRDAIDILADDAGLARFGGFRLQAGDVAQDQVMHDMACVLLPLFGNPDQANQLFTDNLMMAIGAHVLAIYGDAARMTATSKGGLAPWQDKRAKELLLANIGRDASIDDIAQDCGLSSGRFSKAFKEGNGVSPHKWLLAQRVEFAKSMLSGEETSLADIATSSGFSDQSHFTHTFTKLAGMSPGLSVAAAGRSTPFRMLKRTSSLNCSGPAGTSVHPIVHGARDFSVHRFGYSDCNRSSSFHALKFCEKFAECHFGSVRNRQIRLKFSRRSASFPRYWRSSAAVFGA